MKPVLRRALAAVCIAAGALVPHSPASDVTPFRARAVFAAERQTDLQGTWILNKDLGADPIGELDTHPSARPLGAGGMAAPGGSGAGTGGPLIGGQRRIARMDAEEMARVKEMLRQIMASPAKITVTVDGPEIEIVGDDGTIHRLQADGKKLRDRSFQGLEIEQKTKWNGDELVTEYTLKDSEAKARQTWTRTGTRLRVLTKLTPPNGAESLEVRRGYDLEGAAK